MGDDKRFLRPNGNFITFFLFPFLCMKNHHHVKNTPLSLIKTHNYSHFLLWSVTSPPNSTINVSCIPPNFFPQPPLFPLPPLPSHIAQQKALFGERVRAQMWLLWLPKCTSTTTKTSEGVTSTASITTMVDKSRQECCCGSLQKMLKKLKKQVKMLRATSASKQSSFQCRYDPLSYSLNFDTSGYGSLEKDQDYYQFCAFSSRFVGNPRASLQRLTAAAASH